MSRDREHVEEGSLEKIRHLWRHGNNALTKASKIDPSRCFKKSNE